MDVFFYEAFAEEEQALRSCLPEVIRAGFTKATIQESGHAGPPAGIVSIRTQSVIPREWATHMRAILTRSTGYDHVRTFLDDTGSRLPAGYLPLYCSRAVAEQALLLWLGLMRRIRAQTDHLPRFERDGLTGMECQGRTLVVVGVGSIGHEVCRIGAALGMRVIGVDIVERHGDVEYLSRDEAIPLGDVMVCAMNLTTENRGYFSEALLRTARPGAIFVNIARGEFAREQDLLKLLDEGRLAGVGLDVYQDEAALATALRAGSAESTDKARTVLALARHPRAILTPHNAFNTVESVGRKARQSVQQVEHFLRHGEFIWNVPR
jgi:D-lactate dehydrogenase